MSDVEIMMKRFELLHDENKKWDVVKPICDALADSSEITCEKCPFAEGCGNGNNGLIEWLMEGAEE